MKHENAQNNSSKHNKHVWSVLEQKNLNWNKYTKLENATYILIHNIIYKMANQEKIIVEKNLKNFCNKLLLPFKDGKRKNKEKNKINQNKIKTQFLKYIYKEII